MGPGRFIIIDKLGEGGMGEVFSAYDQKLDRKIALKVLSGKLGLSETARARLIREAKALARLSHPHVVTVYDAGTVDDQVFIAMELVEGRTIRQWLQDAPRTWVEIVEVFTAAAEGLAAMHEHGLVHRDFKPDNVLVDARGRIRLIDFGLVRQLGGLAPVLPPGTSAADIPTEPVPALVEADAPAEPDPTAMPGPAPAEPDAPAEPPDAPAADDDELTVGAESLTRTGSLMGTIQYMSPEQFGYGTVTASSDQFSFCVALFEGLFGFSPFQGDSSRARAYDVMFGRVAAIPRDTDVPPELTAVVTRGLRRNPEERWPSMGELLTMLRGIRSSYDPELEDPGIQRTRNRLLLTSVLVVGVGIGIFTALVATDRVAYTLGSQVICDAVTLALLGILAAVLRSQWSTHRRPRQVVGVIAFVLTLYLVQDLTGWLTDRPLYHCLLGNLVGVAVALVFAAPLVTNTLRWCGLWFGACAVMMLVDPPRFALYFALGNLGAGLVAALVLPRRARLRWISMAASEGSATSQSRRGSGRRGTVVEPR